MLARQAATRRLFQVNTQTGATGVIVVDEVTLTAERVISFSSNAIPWGMSVDEPNRLLFAHYRIPIQSAWSTSIPSSTWRTSPSVPAPMPSQWIRNGTLP